VLHGLAALLFVRPRLRRPLRLALFPYTTLFRSEVALLTLGQGTGMAEAGLAQAARAGRGGGSDPADPRDVLLMRGSTTDLKLVRSEEHTSELQSREKLVCRLLLDKEKFCPEPPQ